MDSSEKIKRKANPWQNANVLSKLLFLFAFNTFRNGYQKELEEKDVYQTLKACNSKKLGPLLEAAWDKEKLKAKPNILIPLLKVFGKKIAFYGLTYLVMNTSILVITPFLKGKVVSYFTPDKNDLTKAEAYYYVFTLLLCTLCNTIFIHGYVFGIEQLGLQNQVGLCALLYRKLLRIDSLLTSQVASGQLVTLITKDINSFDYGVFLMNKLWVGTIQVFVMAYLMYRQIGISAVIGGSVLFVAIPIQAYLGSKTSKYRRNTAERTDERVKITQEVLTAMRIIKMYTWELFFTRRVSRIRKKEIRSIKILVYIRHMIFFIGHLNYRVALFVCIISYVGFGHHIKAEQAFTVMGYFTVLRVVISIYLPASFAFAVELQVSLKRITNFLLLKEVENNASKGSDRRFDIAIKNASVVSETKDIILDDVSLNVKSGLTILTGPLGSGKSTLLKLILGEVQESNGIVETPQKISLASQEPWLFPGTIKQNIIFNENYDEKRYNMVVDACELRRDFEELPHCDKTIVSDKGLNLSRGQKTRVNLARAVYSMADVYLLDDCFSSIDSKVSKQIFQNCVKIFLKDKVCLLVTYQSRFLQEADCIVILDRGSVAFQGNYAKLQGSNNLNELNLNLNNKSDQEDEERLECKSNINNNMAEPAEIAVLNHKQENREKNIYEEKKEVGSVKKDVYLTYFRAGGGIKMAIAIIAIFIATQAAESWSDYFVSYWVDIEQELSGFKFNGTTNSTAYLNLNDSYHNVLKLYFVVICTAVGLTILRSFVFYIFTSSASVNVHNTILEKVVNAEMIFFDMNLSGSVINRFSRDLGIIDEVMPMTIFECLRITLVLGGSIYVITSVHAMLLGFSAVFIILLVIARYLYLPSARSIRRLEGSTRSPVIGHLNATLDGLLTIRSNHAQNILINEFDKHLNLYNSCVHMHMFTTRAFGFYLDTVCVVYISSITLSFLLFQTDTLAGKVGLAITQAFSLTGTVQWLVRQWADLENHMTSVERISEYSKISSENKLGISPSSWPSKGKIVYNNVSLKYFETSEMVLKDITFTILPKQKIGIVGRTGAGKSSIISTLFKMYKFEGSIFIDEVDINEISVEYLRTQISIIPQDPVLFSGTIRSNLDPNNNYDDKVLWDALEDVGMRTSVTDLTAPIDGDGLNFSVGQKQLLNLARAIVQSNAILVLDEATANIDPQTDLQIQEIIKKKFVDCTVITIAHRLNTIMNSDRILVLDSGKLIEYDHPEVLLSNKDTMFYKIVKDSNM